MFDPDVSYAIKYAIKDGPDIYELFGEDHISLGFQSEEYITQYKIPLYSKEYQQLWFDKRFRNL